MPAKKRAGKYLYHGRLYTPRQWRAKWATQGFKRKPRRRKR